MKTAVNEERTELQQAMASGVYVEFCDQDGHTAGQAVYADWNGRPVPDVGDTVLCTEDSPSARKLSGKVTQRQFEVTVDDDGSTCVWVHLLVEIGKPARKRAGGKVFSMN